MSNGDLIAVSGQGVLSSVFAVRKPIACQAKWRSAGAGSYGCAGVVVGTHWLREVMRTAGCQIANRKTAKKTNPTSNDISSEQNTLHQLGNFHYLLVMISLQSQGDRGQIKKKKIYWARYTFQTFSAICNLDRIQLRKIPCTAGIHTLVLCCSFLCPAPRSL